MINKLSTVFKNMFSNSEREIASKVNELVDYVNNNPIPTPSFKKYVASVNWSSTTVTYEETINELGGDVTISYDSTGYVIISGTGLMGSAEANVNFNCTGITERSGMTWSDSNSIFLNYYNTSGVSANPSGELIKVTIEIYD